MSENTPYDELFAAASDKVKEYPNCEKLKWNVAVMLDAWRIAYQIPENEKYDARIHEWYSQVLDSEDPAIRKSAAESLYGFYYRKEDYEKAASYLSDNLFNADTRLVFLLCTVTSMSSNIMMLKYAGST